MKVKELLADKNRWTQNVYARDAFDTSCGPLEERAICFCIIGAIKRCYGDKESLEKHLAGVNPVLARIKEHLIEKGLGKDIAYFNDTHTHEEVLAVLEKLDI